MPFLQVAHLLKSFAATTILNDISFEVNETEIVCLLGPSGCGKTTLLRLIAGLETADSGTIVFAGQDVQHLPVHQRNFGLMFQDFALFPHKNVWDNVIFGLRMQNLPPEQIKALGKDALASVGLSGFAKRNVHQLSGGERQRVALARSLAPKPKLLMLDEPLGALDRQLREELMIELRRILKAARLTSIYVTHDQSEAFAIADRVAIMNAGRIEQIDTPQAIYQHPTTEFVARFLGMPNLITGVVVAHSGTQTTVRTLFGDVPLVTERAVSLNQIVPLVIRSDKLTVATAGETRNSLAGRLIDVSFRGRYQRLVVRVADLDLVLETEIRADLPASGQPVKVSLQPEALCLLST